MTGRGRPKAKPPKNANGDGSVFFDKSKGRFRAAITVLDPLTGKRQRRSKLADSEAEGWELVKQMRADTGGSPEMPTLGEWADVWMDTVLATCAVSTEATGRAAVKKWVTEHKIGTYLLDRVTPEHVDAWMMDMAKAGRALDTIKTNRKHLNQMMVWAVKRGRIASNPVVLAELPKVAKAPRSHVVFTLDEATKFAEACRQDDEPWGTFFLLCAMTGMRPGEALALHWSDVDVEQRTIHIHRSVSRSGDKAMGLGPTKTLDERIIEITDDELALLDRQRIERPRPASRSLADYVFLSPTTGTVSPQSNVRKQLTRLCWDAGVRRLPPYDLRHSCASLMLAAGVNPGDVAKRLGTSIRMLDRHYHHLIGKVNRAGAVEMASIYGAA